MEATEATEAVGRCPICGSRGRRLYLGGLADRLAGRRSAVWQLQECAGCGSAYLDPRPTSATLADHYRASGYYTHRAPGSGRPSLGRRLALGYVADRLGYSPEDAIGAGRWLVPLIPGGVARARHRVRDLPAPRNGARLLDVGCGNGEFLSLMSGLGWQASGVDPDPAAVAAARAAGLDAHVGVLDPESLGTGAFDAITLSHVIEHVPEPPSLLDDCLRALRPGGMLWIATPNLRAEGRRRFGAAFISLDPPRHLTIFTRNALRALAVACGFEQIEDVPPRPQAADWVFAGSRAIELGGTGEEPAPLSLGLRLRAQLADARGLLDPGRSQEIALTARAPTDGLARLDGR